MQRSTVVIGGGVAGLVAARELAAKGDRVVLLEASDQPGGAIRSAVLDGVTVDVGAEAFAITRPETRQLIDDLGLGDRVIAPRRSDAHLLLPGGLRDMPHAMLGIPTNLHAPEVLAVLGTEAAVQAARLDSAPVEQVDGQITLGALVRSRMGDDVVERILLPVVAGVHAADPDLVEADAVIPGILAALRAEGSLAAAAARLRAASGVPGSAIAGLSGGMTTLVDALTAAAHGAGVEIRLGTRVDVIEPGERWRLLTAAGALEADDLVIAIDAPAAAALLTRVPDVAGPLSRIRVGDVAVVAAVVLAPELDADPVGSGVLVAPGHPQVRAKALTHATAKWDWIRAAFGPGRHLVRLSYGRDGHIDEALDDLPRIVQADVGHILGLDEPRITDLRIVRWDRSLVQPVVGHRETVSAVRAALEASPTLALAGGGLGGNGLAGTIAQSMTVAAQLTRH